MDIIIIIQQLAIGMYVYVYSYLHALSSSESDSTKLTTAVLDDRWIFPGRGNLLEGLAGDFLLGLGITTNLLLSRN